MGYEIAFEPAGLGIILLKICGVACTILVGALRMFASKMALSNALTGLLDK
jgi:uncharacterized integral membrane protein